VSVPGLPVEGTAGGLAVLRNRPFLLLWLSQLATQVGGNMVLYGLTVVILEATSLSSAVSALFLTFLVPAVLFSAVAGVYVDRLDRRVVLVVTNVLRAALLLAMWAVGPDLGLLLLFNVILSTLTVFFAPAEAAMIPALVPRDLCAARPAHRDHLGHIRTGHHRRRGAVRRRGGVLPDAAGRPARTPARRDATRDGGRGG
jgi:hypothetical protein